jgi:hypothetical protein
LLGGAEADVWAGIELSQIAIDDPDRAWRIIQRINQIEVDGTECQNHVGAAVGCGAIEDLITLHEETMLPIVVDAATRDPVLREELSCIYESSIGPKAWVAIQTVLGLS